MTYTINISNERLAATLSAACTFASDDPTRSHLCSVAIAVDDGRVAFVATNGHALARLHPIDARLTDKLEDQILALIPLTAAKTLAKRAKEHRKIAAPASISIEGNTATCVIGPDTVKVDLIKEKFPPYQAVIPAKRAQGEKDVAAVVGINPQYLAEAATAVQTFLGTKRSTTPLALSVGKGALDPVRIDACGGNTVDAGDATIVIMPMRL